MIEQKYIDSLKSLGTDTTPHSGRTLFDHLQGTHDLLQEWDNSEAVCLGGLYHSIYGTQAFKITTVPLDQRDTVRATIGAEAEQLAYLICVCNRKTFYPDHPDSDPNQVHDVVHDLLLDVTDKQLNQLLEIEAANYLDQLPIIIRKFTKEDALCTFNRFLRYGDRISPKAQEAMKAAVAIIQDS